MIPVYKLSKIKNLSCSDTLEINRFFFQASNGVRLCWFWATTHPGTEIYELLAFNAQQKDSYESYFNWYKQQYSLQFIDLFIIFFFLLILASGADQFLPIARFFLPSLQK